MNLEPGRNGVAHHRDVDRKQDHAAAVLRDSGCDHLLLLDPANVAWFCGTGLTRSADPGDQPAVFLTDKLRWLVANNLDAPRLFAGPLDDQGFQLKEWPWHLGRDSWLADLCTGRKTACDRPAGGTVYVGDKLKRLRRQLSAEEFGRLDELGRLVAHAVEATGRNLAVGQSEAEVAGQLGHRLLHHGAEPVTLTVAADGRYRDDRRPGFTGAAVTGSCVVAALAARHGLHAFAARTVHFGPLDARTKADADAACRLLAAWVGLGKPTAIIGDVVRQALPLVADFGADGEWHTCPPGFVTGYAAVESWLSPASTEVLEPGWAVAWQAGVGAVGLGDTAVTGPEPRPITPSDNWPTRRVTLGGTTVIVPDVFVR